MKFVFIIVACLFLSACSSKPEEPIKQEVKIVTIVKMTSIYGCNAGSYTIVETISNNKRYHLCGTWGQIGDIFNVEIDSAAQSGSW